MRKLLLATISIGVIGLCVLLQADGPKSDDSTSRVTLQLQNADNGEPIAGIVRVYRAGEDKPMPLPGLYDRLRGLKPTATLAIAPSRKSGTRKCFSGSRASSCLTRSTSTNPAIPATPTR